MPAFGLILNQLVLRIKHHPVKWTNCANECLYECVVSQSNMVEYKDMCISAQFHHCNVNLQVVMF